MELTRDFSETRSWQPQEDSLQGSDEFRKRKTIQVSPMPLSSSLSTTTTTASASGSNNNNNVLAPYGTRLSTVLLVRNNGQVLFIERDIWKLGDEGVPVKSDPPTERKYIFNLDIH